MVEALGINTDSYEYNIPQIKTKRQEESIFLEQRLEEIEDKQGILGKTWNGIKEITTLGVSESDCEKMLEKYNKGEISFDEALNYLDEYDSKQESMSGLLSNIATGIGSIILATGAAMATGGSATIAWGLAFKKGAPIGAAIKAGIGILDRATNDIDDDALDLKQVSKDAISGALTGTTSAVSSGVGKGFGKLANGQVTKGQILTSVKNGVKCGVTCGSMSGAATYLTDVAFGDKEYSTQDLVKNTATSAFVSGTVGGVVGAGLYGINNVQVSNALKHHIQTIANPTKTQTIIKDSISSSTRKVAGNKMKKAINV